MNNLSSYILWVCWRKNKSFWQRFTCSHRGNLGNIWKSSLGFSHVEISFGNLVRFKSVSFWPEDRCLLRQFLLWFLICFLLRKRAKTFNLKTQLFKVLITQPFWRLRFQLFLSCQLEFCTVGKSLSEALFFLQNTGRTYFVKKLFWMSEKNALFSSLFGQCLKRSWFIKTDVVQSLLWQ